MIKFSSLPTLSLLSLHNPWENLAFHKKSLKLFFSLDPSIYENSLSKLFNSQFFLFLGRKEQSGASITKLPAGQQIKCCASCTALLGKF